MVFRDILVPTVSSWGTRRQSGKVVQSSPSRTWLTRWQSGSLLTWGLMSPNSGSFYLIKFWSKYCSFKGSPEECMDYECRGCKFAKCRHCEVTRRIGESSSLKLVKGVRRTYYWGYSCKNCEFSNNLESYKENFSLEFISSFGSSTERSKSSPPIVTLAFLKSQLDSVEEGSLHFPLLRWGLLLQ